jgi:hypothetical protein
MKTLLAFFGQYRSFDEVIPQLKNLDKVDIVISTWKYCNYKIGERVEVDKEHIFKCIPNLKQCFLHSRLVETDFNNKRISYNGFNNMNTLKMYYHWKTILNETIGIDEYDFVILHRTDMVSDWEKFLNIDLEKDCLYNDHGNNTEDGFWIDDRFLIGSPNILKKFVNLIDINDERFIEPHKPLGKIINEHGIKINKISVREDLIK